MTNLPRSLASWARGVHPIDGGKVFGTYLTPLIHRSRIFALRFHHAARQSFFGRVFA